MQLAELSKKMILTICIVTFAAIAASVIYYRSLECLPFVWGGLLGGAVSIAKVFMLRHIVDKSLTMEKNTGSNFIRLQHLLRLFLTAVVLVLAAVVPGISLWGAAAGVLSYQIAVYSLKFTAKL